MVYPILGVALPWLLVAAGTWLIFELIKMAGRIVVRLDALEERLRALVPHAGPASRQSSGQVPPELAGLSPGSTAPEFDLPDLKGSGHTLAEYRGRSLLLIFFNPNCGFCTGMADALAAITTDGKNGVPVPLLVSTGSADDNREMVDEHQLKCPLLLQQQMEVMARYGAAGTPTGYLIDEQGLIASPLTRGADALLALGHPPASGITAGVGRATATNGTPKATPAGRFAASDISAITRSSSEPGYRCEKCKGRKQPCGQCSPKVAADNGKPVPDQVYDVLELPGGASVSEVVSELSARAAHCRRLIISEPTADSGAIGARGLAGIRSFLLKHPDWIVSYREPTGGRLIVLSRDPRDQKAMPSKLARAANFARAVAIHVGDGGRRVTAGQLEERLEICAMCEQRSGDHCSACGCSLLTKAGWRTSKCPLSRWPALGGQMPTGQEKLNSEWETPAAVSGG